MSQMSREYFARNLIAVHDYFHGPNFDVEHYSQKIMDAFMFFGSETPGNKNCFEIIHYGRTVLPNHSYMHYGFKLRDKPVFVQNVLTVLQKIPLPQAVQDHYADLTQSEWNAGMLTAIKVVEAFSLREMRSIESGWNVGSQYFARKLWSLYDHFDDPDFDVAKFNHRIMQAFMNFDWINPDNKQAVQLVEFGKIQLQQSNTIRYGFKIKDKLALIVDILNKIESLPIPDKVREIYPQILDNEWDAIMRMATMIVGAFCPSIKQPS